jgi:starch-binding outer membrane protein, SusD/RagB family
MLLSNLKKLLIMKNKKIIYLGAFIVLATGFIACKKFLNPSLKGVYDQSQLVNKKGINGLLINAYATLDGREGSISEGASNWEWGSMAGGDAYKGTEFTDRVDDNPIMRFELSSSNPLVGGKWDGTYDGIGQANGVLKLIAQVTDMTDAEKKQVTMYLILMKPLLILKVETLLISGLKLKPIFSLLMPTWTK